MIIKFFKELFFILSNFKYFIILIFIYLRGIKIFQITNPAIGHYPIDLFLASKIYGKKTIFTFKRDLNFANQYLVDKFKENYLVKNEYDIIQDIKVSIQKLTRHKISFTKIPGILHMTEQFNYADLFKKKKKAFEFNEKENQFGLSYLKKNKIEKEKFICFVVRTSEYYQTIGKSLVEKNMSYRNVKQENYVPSLEYLIENNYKVIRMGKGVKSKFPFDHKNFIDYALSEDRCDFLDIWLSANCKFFLSNSTGIAMMPLLFDKPIINTNEFPGLRSHSWIPKSIHVPRIVIGKNEKLYNVREWFDFGLHWRNSRELELRKIGVKPIENTPDEILETTKLMEEKIKDNFIVSDLNMKFWHKTKKAWDEFTQKNIDNKKPYEFSDRFTFNHFHKIDGIKTTIPDFYLNKYKDVFIDY